MMDPKYLTPKQIVEELDKYIIGQYEAKRNVAIALRNRWRRMNVRTEIRGEIVPNNILMIGATGCRENGDCPQACQNCRCSIRQGGGFQISRK